MGAELLTSLILETRKKINRRRPLSAAAKARCASHATSGLLVIIIQEIEVWRLPNPVQVIGPAQDVRTKAVRELINRDLQLPPSATATEQVELRGLPRRRQIVCGHADQTERTWMLERVEKGGGVYVKLFGDVGWFLAQVLAGQELKVCRFQFDAHTKSDNALGPQPPSNVIG